MAKRADQAKLVHDWNVRHGDNPVTVRYWPTLDKQGEGKVTTTRSAAELLGGHTAVVWLKGVSGCWALDAIEVEDEVGEVGAHRASAGGD